MHNKVVIVGNLTRDPESRFTPNNHNVCNFAVATNRRLSKNKEEVAYFELEAWNQTASNIQNYCKKGCQVYIEARMKTEIWTDKTTGQNRSKQVFVVEEVKFLFKPEAQPAATPQQASTAPQQAPQYQVPGQHNPIELHQRTNLIVEKGQSEHWGIDPPPLLGCSQLLVRASCGEKQLTSDQSHWNSRHSIFEDL